MAANVPATAMRAGGMTAPCGDGPQRAVSDERACWVELSAMPSTPFWARRHTQAVLGAWQLPTDVIETSVLLVSELITNSIAVTTARPAPAPGLVAGSAGPIVLALRRRPGQIVIEVSDSDPSPPVLTEVGPDAESGRGLMLVHALSKEWSYRRLPTGGKTIYCVIDSG